MAPSVETNNEPQLIQHVPRVPEFMNFAGEEETVLKLWKEIDAFRTSIKQSEGKPRFSFYDGPPFATGLPHYGHILAGTIKDVVTRFAHQRGFHVERRFGWDTHGLPVEFEIDKKLNIKGPDDVMKMGIGNYNAECRKIVMRYADEWEKIMGRIGRWIDFENDYKTLYPWYMESIWFVFKQLFEKGMVYQGNKVMPYSTGCNTPLSNFESGQDYRDVVDPCVTVSLPIIGDKEGAALLVWTTTPWTLPSNLSACVNPTLIYVRLEQLSTGKIFVMMECRIETVFKAGDYKILTSFPGSKLKGLKYEPVFPYFYERMKGTAYVVLTDDYVTSESGTGVVHQAPYFGEDDYRVCVAAGVITRDQEPVCPIDACGKFLKPVVDFEGLYVKDADKVIMANLKERGRLIHKGQVKHSYPFCWRSHTPLIYRSVPSWFVRVEQMTDRLLKAVSTTYWVPDFVKEKRFGNWLRDARDWSISRDRYWGTPIPIWMSPKGDEIVVIGSIAELEELSGAKVTDLHRESIDHLEIPSRVKGNPPLKRIPQVFDCWFESGSMPYAQSHYPFDNEKEFEDRFPASFIAEGIDQTRGWFYTLLVIGTALFDQAPFKNVIASGLVLASDGQKMSKSKRNYPDPLVVVNKYGADSIRMFLINSPVVRAENLRFREEGVKEILREIFLPWTNAFRFLFLCIEGFVQDNNCPYYFVEANVNLTTNIMDKWILSSTESLLVYVLDEMNLYHLYNVAPRLTKFIVQLTNCYVRLNRPRLKGENGKDDCEIGLTVLFSVLVKLMKIMAPFAPFCTETMYQYVKEFTKSKVDSVHYIMMPQPSHDLINLDIERRVSRMQTVIELVRVIRERKTLPSKLPLPEVVVVHQDPQYIEDILSLQNYLYLETNVKKITTTMDKARYGVSLKAEPDFRVLGSKLKQDLKKVAAAIQALTDEEIKDMMEAGTKTIHGHVITIDEIRPIFKAETVNSGDHYEVNSDNNVLILLNVVPSDQMKDEGTAREIINRVQKLRKKAKLVPTDQITVFYKTSGDLERIASNHTPFIRDALKSSFLPQTKRQGTDYLIIEECQRLKDCDLDLMLTRNSCEAMPVVNWANLQVVGLSSNYAGGSTKGMVLLEVGNTNISYQQLVIEIYSLFGLEHFKLVDQLGNEVMPYESCLRKFNGKTIFIVPVDQRVTLPEVPENVPFCKVYNFEEQDIKATIITENPVKNVLVTEEDYPVFVKQFIKAITDSSK